MEGLKKRHCSNPLIPGTTSARNQSQTDRGFLISKSKCRLAASTKSLYFNRMKSKKLAGGIFELIQLKKKFDAMEKEQEELVSGMSHDKIDEI